MPFSLLACALHAQLAWAQPAAEGSLEGTVRGRFQGRLAPLAHAVVEVVAPSGTRTALADDQGRYRFPGLGAGEARLTATHPGYGALTLSVAVPRGGDVRVDVELEATPLALPPLEVRVHPPEPLLPSLESLGATSRRGVPPQIELQALELGPGVGQPGLLEAVGRLPGNDPAKATDVLFMRGSTTDLKLVLLDGVPVYTPFHIAGLMRSFDPGVLGRADLHVGGAPARFDGGLTNILDLRTRTPRSDRFHASGSLDLVAASAAVETPLGARAGVLAAARSLHDLGRAPLGGRQPYGYRDMLLTAVAEPRADHEIEGTGFWNEESVVLDANNAPDEARWANRAASLRYRAGLGGAALELTAGLSGYDATLPLQPTQLPGQPPPAALLASARTDRARFLAELVRGSAAAPLRVGLSAEHIAVSFAARELGGGPSVRISGSTPALGAFVDVTRPLAPKLTLRAGLRADRFGAPALLLAPRGALVWELGPGALLTVTAGRYHQPTRSPRDEVEHTLGEVTRSAAAVAAQELLPVATADHVVLALDQRLAERVALSLQGFWKRYEGLAAAAHETVRSSGIDLRAMSGGRSGTAWVGYGLSWFWSTRDLSGHASEFVGRHLLSAGVSGALAGPLRGEIRVAYGAGLPYSSVSFGDAAAEPLAGSAFDRTGAESLEPATVPGGLGDGFFRVDLEMHVLIEPTWGGRTWRVRPYVRILNALDRRDALFYAFQPWRSEAVRPLAERPLLPLFGVAVEL
jgi:hypothetical protein